MKRLALIMIVAASLAFSQFAAFAESSEMDLLVKMLVENGALTREQANVLALKVKEKAEQQAREMAAQASEGKAAQEIKAEAGRKWGISESSMETKWDDGLRFRTADGNFKVRVGGRVYDDMLYVDGQSLLAEKIRPLGDLLRRNDEAFIRSARLGMDGTIYEDFFFKLEYDFYGDLNTYTEVDGLRGAYMGMKDIPFIGKITVGQMKAPFSLEELESMNDITFVERALPNVFVPGYEWGAMVNNDWFDERLTFAVGAFRNSTHSGTMVSGNEWSAIARATCLPWYDSPERLMHLGASYEYGLPQSGGPNNNFPANEQARFRQRPDLFTRDYIVDTGAFNLNAQNLVGWEWAFMYGPLSIQAEVMQDWLDSPRQQQSTRSQLYGGYAYISYILTGEHREYDRKEGVFKSVRPNNVFSLGDRTWGAWEVALRCSYLNLDDKNLRISGGEAVSTTLGVNWYLNPNMRIMFNWVHADRAGYGALEGIQTRAQVNFD